MKIATIIVRILLGLVFVVFGSNAFLRFIPMPPIPQGLVGDFLRALFESGYVYVIAAFQVFGGLMLLSGRFVPFGLTLLGPVIVNIVFFHVFLDRTGLPIALVLSALALFLLWQYRSAFAGLVKNS